MKKILALIFAFSILSVMTTACDKSSSKTVSESNTEYSTNSKSEINMDNIALKAAPDDFSFSLVWGTYGISSYDSKTGKLVKTTDAEHPEDYVTTYNLKQDEINKIYSLIIDLDPENCPDNYDTPTRGFSSPPISSVLTINYGDVTKTMRSSAIGLSDSIDEKEKAFLTVHNKIVSYLTSTAEWQQLLDYEKLYL